MVVQWGLLKAVVKVFVMVAKKVQWLGHWLAVKWDRCWELVKVAWSGWMMADAMGRQTVELWADQ